MENKSAMHAAAEETYALLISKLQKDASVHVGTLVSAAARLAGASLFCSFNLAGSEKVKPGTIILSEIANQVWPELMHVLLAALTANGVEVDQAQFVMQTPRQHAPQMEILEMQAELQAPFNQIMRKHGLEYRQAAFAGANACALTILKSRLLVDPHITCGLAALGFVEGSKTAPLPLEPEQAD